MADKSWIDEQKEIDGFFRGPGHTSDADRMLEKGPANRNTNVRQAKLLIAARLLGRNLGINCLHELSDDVEYAELVINKDSRKDFMKVAIEQWQAKLQAAKSRIRELSDRLL